MIPTASDIEKYISGTGTDWLDAYNELVQKIASKDSQFRTTYDSGWNTLIGYEGKPFVWIWHYKRDRKLGKPSLGIQWWDNDENTWITFEKPDDIHTKFSDSELEEKYQSFKLEVAEYTHESEAYSQFSRALEKDIENALVNDLSQIEQGLKLFDDGTKSGHQYTINDSRIDLLCVDKDDNLVVVELKRYSSEKVVSQIAKYLGLVKKKFAKEKVRGIILAQRSGDDVDLLTAAHGVNLEVKWYTLKVQVEPAS